MTDVYPTRRNTFVGVYGFTQYSSALSCLSLLNLLPVSSQVNFNEPINNYQSVCSVPLTMLRPLCSRSSRGRLQISIPATDPPLHQRKLIPPIKLAIFKRRILMDNNLESFKSSKVLP
jgi:hypothetical protein